MASLKTEYSIKKFAPLITIAYSKVNCTTPELVGCFGEFMNDEISKEIFNCVNLLLKHYKDITDKISIQEFEERLYVTSKKRYTEQLVTRCLKLSEGEPTFFEFLLVCVYICKFSECIYARYRCCKILKVTADCLEAVYCIKYWNCFAENNGFQGFADFCKSLNNCTTLVKNVNGECITLFPEAVDPERNEKVKNLGCLNVVDDVVSFSEMKRKPSDDKPYFVPSRRNVSTDFLVEWYVANEDKEVKMGGWEDVPEKIYKTGIRCEHCLAKCSQYLKDLVDEIKRNEILRL